MKRLPERTKNQAVGAPRPLPELARAASVPRARMKSEAPVRMPNAPARM
jgi:hypothetical protein